MKQIYQITFYARHPLLFISKLKSRITGTTQKSNMEVEDFLSILPDNPVIIEAGASRGMDTVKFAKH